LGHDQLDIFVLQTSRIDLFGIILVLILLAIPSLNSLALAMVVVVVMVVVVASVIMSGMVMSLLRGQFLSGRDLGLGVEILNLGFAEDAV
jgi:hypothetical protein